MRSRCKPAGRCSSVKVCRSYPRVSSEQIYKRQGVVISSSTMNGWVHQLSPYMKLMSEYIKEQILQSSYIQQDESSIKVMDGKRKASHTGYMWVMGSTELKHVCFEYHKGRGREGPRITLNNTKDFYKQMRMKYMTL
ncbi:MAG: transposase [Saprospiraceae bacterium]|nr:transposase [Saprospiraceae bacterium]